MNNSIKTILLYLFFSVLMLNALNGQDIEKIINAKPFDFGGSITGKVGFASINGTDQRAAPYYYGFNARLKLSFYSFNVPLYVSFRDNGLRYGRNFPRLKISPKYKWASMQIGDVYTQFNPYVLDNRNMRGAAIKLTPGKFRFQALYGRMKELNSFRDTLQLGVENFESYSRKIAGLGLGVGSSRSYVDLYLLRSWDDEIEEFYTERDANQQSNTVVGLSTRLRLFKRLSFETNVGLSALTQNVNTPGEIETLVENGLTGSLAEVNASTNINFAGDVSLSYRYRKLGLSLRTRYIQPHYQPLTVAYINTDLLDYTIGANISLFKNKLFLNGRLGIQENNLSKQDAVTTKRVIYNVVATGKLSKALTANLVIANFSNQLQASSITVNELFTYSVTNNATNMSLRYRKSNEDGITASVKAGRSNFTIVSDNEVNNTYSSIFLRSDLGYNWESIGAQAELGLGYTKYNREEINSNTYTVSARASKNVYKDLISLNFDSRFTLIDLIEFREGTNWLNQVNANYKLTEKSAFSLYVGHINRVSYINPRFQEIRSSLSYRLSF